MHVQDKLLISQFLLTTFDIENLHPDCKAVQGFRAMAESEGTVWFHPYRTPSFYLPAACASAKAIGARDVHVRDKGFGLLVSMRKPHVLHFALAICGVPGGKHCGYVIDGITEAVPTVWQQQVL